MRRLVFITQRLDAEDPIVGATVAKVAALAARVDELVVICDHAQSGGLPENCRVRMFGARSQAARGVRMLSALSAELRPRPIGVVAHMIPLYAVLAAPLVRPVRLPLLLWYTHWEEGVVLRAAARVCTAVATVDERSFPFASPKLHAIGHGIEVSSFRCEEPEPSAAFRVLALGRYSTGKGLDELLHAQKAMLDRGVDVQLTIHGPAGDEHERAHLAELRRLHDALSLGETTKLNGPVPRTRLQELFARTDALVSNHDSADKVVYEAAAACRPVLVSHDGFAGFVDGIEPSLRFKRGDPQSLADALTALAATTPAQRHAIGKLLRERVAAHHSTDTWAAAILSLCR